MIKVTPEFSTKITIPAKQSIQYPYNHVNELVKKEQVTAVFGTDCIDITAPSKTQSKNIIEKLKEIGINFVAQTKKD